MDLVSQHLVCEHKYNYTLISHYIDIKTYYRTKMKKNLFSTLRTYLKEDSLILPKGQYQIPNMTWCILELAYVKHLLTYF